VVYDDDTGRRVSFDIDDEDPPPGKDPARAARRQILEVARWQPNWGAVEIAHYLRTQTRQDVPVDFISSVLQRRRER
jgi:hypothetical protein